MSSANSSLSIGEKSEPEVIENNSRSTNCVISIMPADDLSPEKRSRREEERDLRLKVESLSVGPGLPSGTAYRARSRSMVGRLPSDSARSESDTSGFRRAKTIELANEWASDSELDSMDSDSMSNASRLTPSPLPPFDDDRDRVSSGVEEPLSEVLRDSKLPSENFNLNTRKPTSVPVPSRVSHAENHFLAVPVQSAADSSDSDSKALCSDDGSERSEDVAKGTASSVLPKAGRRSSTSQRSPICGKKKWGIVRKAVMTWSPFVQIYRRKYPWVQLAGHQGNFRAGDNGTILKKACDRERDALSGLMLDVLKPFVPLYTRQIEQEGEAYLEMQDLLADFEQPAVMDIKMGVRTYLEEELTKARTKPAYRTDLYQKMIEVDPSEPTSEENARGAIDKPRYMQFRERCSSSWSLGFRIEGIKLPDDDPRSDFKKMRTEAEVAAQLKGFLLNNHELWQGFLCRLMDLREACTKSKFFYSHEIIGSSLLFVAQHNTNTCGVWVIDFGKTSRLPEGQKLDHIKSWMEGNREDGYLWGLNNLIRIWSHLLDDSPKSTQNCNNASGVDESL